MRCFHFKQEFIPSVPLLLGKQPSSKQNKGPGGLFLILDHEYANTNLKKKKERKKSKCPG